MAGSLLADFASEIAVSCEIHNHPREEKSRSRWRSRFIIEGLNW
jgi:hypothetical protein